ncbi:MAG TPA: histidine kinase dimerization/phosphoacceptor domain-containing protein, partial [Solirubrobacter sp.]|nr:histidine kinase dimerization/phosphoacceptor domain-containing protein [Solirubrobacter sp.]
MLRGIDAEVRQRLKPPAFDVAVALLFVAVGQTDVWMPWGDGTPAFDGPQWATCALILAATAPLAWRRRAPLLVAATVIVALVIAVQVSETALFLGGYVPVAVAAYTVAAYGSRARAVLGIAILCLGVLVVTLSIPELRNPGQVVFELPFLATVWIVGRLVHRLRTRAHALTRQAETLERRRDNEARAAVDLERARIARELHDVIAHSVSLMGIQAAAAEQVLALDPERAREPLQAIQNTARDAIDELRRLLGVLRDSGTGIALGPQPGLAALDALVEQMRGAGLAV